MKMNPAGIALIKRWEGFRAKPYICPAGVATIGFGTVTYPSGKKVFLSDPPITEQMAQVYLMNDIDKYSRQVTSMLTVTLSENRYSALVSFAYNLGTGALRRSTLLKVIHAAPGAPGIRDEFMKYVKAKDPKTGKKVTQPGLVSRRKNEADLYFKIA